MDFFEKITANIASGIIGGGISYMLTTSFNDLTNILLITVAATVIMLINYVASKRNKKELNK